MGSVPPDGWLLSSVGCLHHGVTENPFPDAVALLKHLGNDGVAAITAVLYSQFLLTALYLGFSVGVAPILSYHYGAGNCAYLNKLKRICYKFVLATSVLSIVLAF